MQHYYIQSPFMNVSGSLQDIRVNENSAVLQNIPSVAVDGLGRIDRLENVLEVYFFFKFNFYIKKLNIDYQNDIEDT